MPLTYVLNFRSQPSGGDVDINKAQQNLQKLRGLPHLIFFIHGYNDTQLDALKAYTGFSARQQEIVGPGRDWAPGAALVHVFWPGDENWGLLSVAYYPWAVPRAQSVAALLANMLAELGRYATGIVTMDFVAHSLGNRLLLRTLALLPADAKIWVRRVVHMAAAVPKWKLDYPTDGDALAQGLAREANAMSRATSLYSGKDKALGIVFQIGETFTPLHDGLFPIALGSGRWIPSKYNHSFAQEEAKGAEHGDYWGAEDASTTQGKETIRMGVARQVYNELALVSAAPRQLPSSIILASYAEQARDLASRTTVTRKPGGSL